jgi:hypothetical protein
LLQDFRCLADAFVHDNPLDASHDLIEFLQAGPRDPRRPRASFILRGRIKRYAAAQPGIVSGGETLGYQREFSRHLKYIVRT